MSEDLKTIKELADELGVTKQNIQYHYQRLPKELQLKSSNGFFEVACDIMLRIFFTSAGNIRQVVFNTI